jgi:hypothetical protein
MEMKNSCLYPVLFLMLLLCSASAAADSIAHDWENPSMIGINKLPYLSAKEALSRWVHALSADV